MMPRFLFVAHIVFLFLVAADAGSQTLALRHFTETETGAPAYVYDIDQGADGLLYVSAGSCVLAFDGFRFDTVYNGEKAGHIITRLAIDKKGSLFLGLRNGGVLSAGAGTRPVHGYRASAPVTAFAHGADGITWFGTAGAGIWKIDSTGRAVQAMISSQVINALAFTGRRHLLYGTEDGLSLMDTRTQKTKTIIKGHITGVTAGKKGDVWALSDDGVWLLKNTGGNYRVLLSPDSIKALGIPDGRRITVDTEGLVWIASAGSGCYRIQKTGNAGLYVTGYNRENGMADQVETVFIDRENNIWFGTFGDGLYQKPSLRFEVYARAGGLRNTDVRSLALSDSLIWIAGKRGLSTFRPHSLKGEMIDSAKTDITSIVRDLSGAIWVGTENSGLFKFDPVSKRWQDIGAEFTPPLQQVNHISLGGQKVYVGTNSGLAVFQNGKAGAEFLTTNDGLLHNNVKHTFLDKKKRLWISSHGAPPYYIARGKAVPFRNVRELQTFNINAACEDADGKIWIATEGDGVFCYDDSLFTRFTSNDGLLSEFCTGVTSTPEGIWVTHRGGVSEKRNGQPHFSAYAAGSSFPASCNRNSYQTDQYGNVWIGTTAGLVKCKPRRQTADPLPVKILSVKIDEEIFPADAQISREFGHYSVRIDFIAVTLANPAGVVYRYRLLGADTSWQVTAARSVEFPQLTDGEFRFEVTASSDTGRYESPAGISFTIREPVWQRWWFYLLLLAAVAMITYAIVTARTRAFRRRQMLLELKVKQKTFLLRREKDAVVAMKLVVEQKNKDITDSISYAKKIQDSILPPDELMQRLFSDNHFVLFKPKDIVSGDFYWAASLQDRFNRKDPLALAAVVDCTGHGVPGAFLSIMANDFLRQSIAEPGVSTPADILNFLNEKISTHLNQTAHSQIRDGMDLAMIGIDFSRKTLLFSGANNPLYVFRRTGDTIDQVILTAAKQAIGLVTETSIRYTNREFSLRGGDMIYMFSDGFADQFGGENNKKLTYRRFREYLVQAFELPVREQQKFLAEKLEQWRGPQPQTDDICVMGIRIE